MLFGYLLSVIEGYMELTLQFSENTFEDRSQTYNRIVP